MYHSIELQLDLGHRLLKLDSKANLESVPRFAEIWLHLKFLYLFFFVSIIWKSSSIFETSTLGIVCSIASFLALWNATFGLSFLGSYLFNSFRFFLWLDDFQLDFDFEEFFRKEILLLRQLVPAKALQEFPLQSVVLIINLLPPSNWLMGRWIFCNPNNEQKNDWNYCDKIIPLFHFYKPTTITVGNNLLLNRMCSSLLGTRERLPGWSESVLPVTKKEGKVRGIWALALG